MKAVVIEIKGKHAVVMTKKCNFVKIKNNGFMKLGYEVEVPEMTNINKRFFIKAASVAAAMVLVGGISFGAYAYNVPYSYISVDINPSVELTANRFDIVIGAKGLNDDGIDILQNQNLKNKKVKDSVSVIVSEAVAKGYLPKDKEGAVLLTVSSKNQTKADKLKGDLEEKTIEEADDIGVTVEVMSQNAALERRDQAFKMGITPGRLNLIEKLIAAGSDKKVDEFEDVSVKEIMKSIKDLKLEDKQEDKQTGKSDNASSKNQRLESTVAPKSTISPESTVKPQSTPKPESTVKPGDSNKAESTGKPSEAGKSGNNKNK